MAPKKLSGAQIARLSVPNLYHHLDEWGVEHTGKDLISERRGRLERKIVDSEAKAVAVANDALVPAVAATQPGLGCGRMCLAVRNIKEINFCISFVSRSPISFGLLTFLHFPDKYLQCWS